MKSSERKRIILTCTKYVLLTTDEWDRRNVCRTACRYRGKNIAFHVNEGSTSFWLSLLVEFEDGDGDIGSMQLKQVRNSVLRIFFSSYACSCSDV